MTFNKTKVIQRILFDVL